MSQLSISNPEQPERYLVHLGRVSGGHVKQQRRDQSPMDSLSGISGIFSAALPYIQLLWQHA